MATALRILAIVAWGAFMIGMMRWSATTPALIGAGIGTFLLGALVGRWWVLLVPLVLGLPLAALAALTESHELDTLAIAAYVAAWTLGIAFVMAVGVAAHQLARRSGPQHDRGLGVRRPVT